MAVEIKELTKRSENYSQWYQDLVLKADLAENSAVRGCMVIKPYGYAIWERMQRELDDMFKETGHVNAYFPLFIPKSYLSREADHVEGFAKECAVVTHYRLKTAPDGNGVVVDPEAKLEEELIVRPTSETIIWSTYKNWIQSYRDLPILCNQWANVVRWEMRTRLFLRTAEFLWQEGHTAHATKEEAEEEAIKMLNVYANFVENFMALPVIKGVKTPSERFAGALNTYTIEAMMQDGKALQSGTSHFLGQNFAKAFDVTFANKTGEREFVWATSWGVSTRLMGALIMAHSDDNGLVLPPKLAPYQIVIVPIYRSEEQLHQIDTKVEGIMTRLKALGVRVKYDNADNRKPGWKFAEYELKGVPVRLAKGGGSANKTYLYQETKALINPKQLVPYLVEKMKTLGTAACPPYHVAFVIGGTSAEMNLKTVKLASAKYFDQLPTEGNRYGHAFRDVELEKEVLDAAHKIGLGAQFGGKYFAHDVRIIRLPRHGASCPIGLGVSCSADRNIKAKINKDGLWIEKMDDNPGRLIPEELRKAGEGDAVKVNLNRPMKEILEQLRQYPIATRLSLSGTIVVARDIAHAKLKALLDSGKELPQYVKDHPIYYAGPAKTPQGMPSGSFGPTTAGRMDPYVDLFQSHGASMIMIAKGNRSQQVTDACKKWGGFYLGSIGGPAAILAQNNIKKIECLEYPELGMEAIWKIEVEDFPAFILVNDKGEDFFKRIKN